MALKDTWVNKKDKTSTEPGDKVQAKDINDIAHAVIENEEIIEKLPELYAAKEEMAGKNVTGHEFATKNLSTIKEAGVGAEIFNDYRERTFSTDGTVQTGNAAVGEYSHAEGGRTTATGTMTHAEGWHTYAAGNYAHAEGGDTKASGQASHTEGTSTIALYTSAHAEGTSTQANGMASHSEGVFCVASSTETHAPATHAEGMYTEATGNYSHAEGNFSKATGNNAHAEGNYTTAEGNNAHAEGSYAKATGRISHAEGDGSVAQGVCSHAQGTDTLARGRESHAGGFATIANDTQTAIGRYNIDTAGPSGDVDMNGTLFVIGNGTGEESRSTAFRVDTSGDVYAAGQYNTTGADYAEYFEWMDRNPNNEDRRGLFVTLEGEKIRFANANDEYILGVISSTPSVIGDAREDYWHGKFLTDIFGEVCTEIVTVPENTEEIVTPGFVIGDDKIPGETEIIVIPEHEEVRYTLNPNYNPEEEYISRSKREEWESVGMMGKLVVVDDGTCEVNGYCKPTDGGIATKSESGYRVMKRLDDTHIKILFRG